MKRDAAVKRRRFFGGPASMSDVTELSWNVHCVPTGTVCGRTCGQRRATSTYRTVPPGTSP